MINDLYFDSKKKQIKLDTVYWDIKYPQQNIAKCHKSHIRQQSLHFCESNRTYQSPIPDKFSFILQLNKINSIEMEHQLSQNPQIYNDHTMTYSGIIRKNDRLANKQNLFTECRSILQKSHQTRIPSENQTLLRLVDKSEFLKELSQLYGLDFIKGILKNAKLQSIDQRQVIAEQDQEIKYLVIVLQGKLGVEKSSFSPNPQNAQNQQVLENLSLKTDEVFDKLTILAKKEREQLRKNSKMKKKNTIPISEYQFFLPVLSQHDYKSAQANLQRNILINQQFGGKERLNSRFYKNRVISTEKTTIFIIQMSFLFYWLQMAFKHKMIKNIQKLKTIPAFEILENEKLAEIIIGMKLVKKSKNGCIYLQGDSADMIYLLVEGQLKISKQAHLFKQNPNDLYVDRRTLLNHPKNNRSLSKSLKSDDQILPFANLTTLYNYRPTKKSIDMGIISSFGLFGQQQVILKIKRETTVHVNSIQASYYQIDYKKILQIIGNKYVDRFRQALEASISKKVLYRQSQFAEQVLLQNQNNLNYFYLDQGKKQQPKKVKLQKINQLVSPESSKDTADHAPAFYTTFNFNKMLQKRYTTIDRNQRHSNFKTLNDSTDLIQPDVSYSGAEFKMVNMSHTWDIIQKKVMQEHSLSRRISPIRQQINIDQPLIDQQFLTDVAKQHRRINRQFRTIKLTLGKRVK